MTTDREHGRREVLPTDKWVIYDPKNTGYAVKSPIEGWIFTTRLSAATRFDTEAEAKATRKEHYGTCVGLRVIPVSK